MPETDKKGERQNTLITIVVSLVLGVPYCYARFNGADREDAAFFVFLSVCGLVAALLIFGYLKERLKKTNHQNRG